MSEQRRPWRCRLLPCSLLRSLCWSDYQVESIRLCSSKICAVLQNYRIAEVGWCFWRLSSLTTAQRRLPRTMSSWDLNYLQEWKLHNFSGHLLMTNALNICKATTEESVCTLHLPSCPALACPVYSAGFQGRQKMQ